MSDKALVPAPQTAENPFQFDLVKAPHVIAVLTHATTNNQQQPKQGKAFAASVITAVLLGVAGYGSLVHFMRPKQKTVVVEKPVVVREPAPPPIVVKEVVEKRVEVPVQVQAEMKAEPKVVKPPPDYGFNGVWERRAPKKFAMFKLQEDEQGNVTGTYLPVGLRNPTQVRDGFARDGVAKFKVTFDDLPWHIQFVRNGSEMEGQYTLDAEGAVDVYMALQPQRMTAQQVILARNFVRGQIKRYAGVTEWLGTFNRVSKGVAP